MWTSSCVWCYLGDKTKVENSPTQEINQRLAVVLKLISYNILIVMFLLISWANNDDKPYQVLAKHVQHKQTIGIKDQISKQTNITRMTT